ncbi:MAG: bioA [Chitinophagaceae bacterium]|nr:bioA [Chitinophagaceae bacterium]
MQSTDLPLGIVRGEGACLYDENGRKYIDAISSWWVNIHGHAHPYIADKVYDQLKKMEHVIFAGFTHEPAVELAEKLLSILPGNQSKIFYSDNGSTAVEVALKMSLQYWNNQGITKNKILAFEHSYHGDTFGAMSVSGRSGFTKPFAGLLFDVIHIPPPVSGLKEESLSALTTAIANAENDIAAFIFEPLVLGAGGMLMYEAGELDELIALCRQKNILIIADEVMTGFGRTGKLFASAQLKNKPDIICLSKGITGGTMPLGATSCIEKIFNGFLSDDKAKTFFHGHSYTANPIACAAALASYDLLVNPVCGNNIKKITESHEGFIERNKANLFLKNIRSTGTILAMDFINNEQISYFNSLRDTLYNFFLSKGIILRPLGNTVYVMPPYCITEEELNAVYGAIETAGNVLY